MQHKHPVGRTEEEDTCLTKKKSRTRPEGGPPSEPPKAPHAASGPSKPKKVDERPHALALQAKQPKRKKRPAEGKSRMPVPAEQPARHATQRKQESRRPQPHADTPGTPKRLREVCATSGAESQTPNQESRYVVPRKASNEPGESGGHGGFIYEKTQHPKKKTVKKIKRLKCA